MRKAVQIKADILFKKELDFIKKEKIKNNTSDRMLSDRRLTKALRKLKDWNLIKDRIIKADIMDDRNEND